MPETECANIDEDEWNEMSREEKIETCKYCGFNCDYAKRNNLLVVKRYNP